MRGKRVVVRRIKGAQHKRPGRTARRVRQEAALDRLMESEALALAHDVELASLRRSLGYAPIAP